MIACDSWPLLQCAWIGIACVLFCVVAFAVLAWLAR